MKNKLGILCMGAGMVLLTAAAMLFLHNQAEDRQAGEAVQQVVTQLLQQQESLVSQQEPAEIIPFLPLPTEPQNTEMTETEIDGHRYIGYVMLPTLDRVLPVMTDWSYPQLQISPCRYGGSTKTDDLVIMAHNYDKHFGTLQNLSPGDAVLFSDMDGAVHSYEVVTVGTLGPEAVEEMMAGEYDLTLFTCTYGGGSRVTVRCDRTLGGTP